MKHSQVKRWELLRVHTDIGHQKSTCHNFSGKTTLQPFSKRFCNEHFDLQTALKSALPACVSLAAPQHAKQSLRGAGSGSFRSQSSLVKVITGIDSQLQLKRKNLTHADSTGFL